MSGRKKQQPVFTYGRDISDATRKASYLIADKIAVASKPFIEGGFITTCMVKVAEIVYLEKRRAFVNVSLRRNTIADRISDLSVDLDGHLKNKIKTFIVSSVADDESTDITDVAQLAIFIGEVDDTLTVIE